MYMNFIVFNGATLKMYYNNCVVYCQVQTGRILHCQVILKQYRVMA